MGRTQHHDPQGAACDLQFLENNTRDQRNAACDSQPQPTVIAKDTGAIPRKKTQRPSRTDLGMHAGREILNETPVDINSPKRRLVWSPETLSGRSRKYSIGEAASPRLRQEIPGVISLDGQCAIPTFN